MRRAFLLCCCLTLAACNGHVDYRGPGLRYQGSPGPLAVVAVGAVMAYELAVLAAPAFTVEGSKPRSRAAEARAARPVDAPQTLVLMTIQRGPAENLPLADLAKDITAALAERGVALADESQGPADPVQYRYAVLEQRGLRRALVVALDVEERRDATGEVERAAVARLRLMDVTARSELAARTLRRPVGPGQTPAQAQAVLAPRVAEAMAAMLADPPGKDTAPGTSP